MLDIKYIREHADEVQQNAKNRLVDVDIKKLLEIDEKRVKLIGEVDNLRGKLNLKGKPTPEELKKLKKVKEDEEKLSKKLNEVEAEFNEILAKVPNLTHPDVKVSADEDDNPILEIVKEPKKFNFEPQDHLALAEKLDLIDFERGAKVAGGKFYYLKNELALLEFALIQYTLETAMKHDFIPFSTPDLAKREVLEGLGFNPRGDSTQVYNVEGTDLSLIGTAEITMGGYHMNEVLDEKELPKKYVAVSHCFRTEAGSYSKFSKGIFRVHQFTKIEMFQYVLPENAEKAHNEILNVEKEIYTGLDIPFRIIDHCTADLGAPAFRTFDLEAWMPGKPNKDGSNGDWAEITSTSNCTDFQARGLNIKYKDTEGKKSFVYMLNGTAVAVTRTLIAILENNQQADGSILIPKVLQKWVGRDKIERN